MLYMAADKILVYRTCCFIYNYLSIYKFITINQSARNSKKKL